MNRINKLDGLRGLFALFVVLFHLNVNNAPHFLVHNFFIRESYIFVDFFFILSGYVISLTYDKRILNGRDLFSFLKKRFIRLYPLLLFSTCMYWYFVHPQWNNAQRLLVMDTLLLTNATPILGTGIGMNYPSWSISSEMISYLFFGCCSIIALAINKRWLMGIITFCCFVFLAVHQNYFVTGDYGFIRGLACFNLGYFVFIITAKPFHLPNYFEVCIGGLIILLMYAYHLAVLNNSKVVLGIQFLIPLAFAVGILTLIKTNGLLSKILQTRPLIFLGKISYSVYLNQALIIGYFIPKLYKWVNWSQGETKKTICVLLLLIILIVYSWVTQFIIENKLGKKLASWAN